MTDYGLVGRPLKHKNKLGNAALWRCILFLVWSTINLFIISEKQTMNLKKRLSCFVGKALCEF